MLQTSIPSLVKFDECAPSSTGIKEPVTFLLLVAIDVCINMYYAVKVAMIVVKIRAPAATVENIIVADSGENASAATNKIALQRAQRRADHTTNPLVAHLCGNLFCAEMAEVVAPAVMACVSLLLFYGPGNNREYFSFMIDKTEAAFLQGMLYVLLDALIEMVTFAVILKYLHKVVGVDATRVGFFLMLKHAYYYFAVTVMSSTCFIALYVEHFGHDTTFTFPWLSSSVNITKGHSNFTVEFTAV